MSTSRIDELRSKFDENPRRYFAPLANEYRKAGDLATAIALCREHLPKQPGHMSGHIVYGQALFDAGILDESQQVFEAALALDPENVIALQHLGEIARANGDTVLARRWYERLLDADPRNDEIAQQLASIFTPPIAVSAVETSADEHPAAESVVAAGEEPVGEANRVEPIDFSEVDDAGEVDDTEESATTAASSDVQEPAYETPVVAYEAGAFSPVATPDSELAAVEHGNEWDAHEPIDLESSDQVVTSLDETVGSETQLVEVTSRSSTPAEDAQAIDDAFADAEQEAVSDGFAMDYAVDEEERAQHAARDAEPIDIGNALDAFDAHDPVVELDPDESGEPMALADVDAPPSLSTHDYSAEFEEGLIAPEWPDTASLLSRVEHPPEVAAVTPAYSQDAVDAFGREDVDPEVESIDDDIEYGEREMVRAQEAVDPQQEFAPTEAEHVAETESVAETEIVVSAGDAGKDDVAATDTMDFADAADDVSSDEAPVVAAVNADVDTDATPVDDNVVDVPEETKETSAHDDVTSDEVAAEAESRDEHDAVEDVVTANAEDEERIVDQQVATVGAELQEDTHPDDEGAFAEILDAPEDVQEVARALSRDARASGETEAIRIETHESEASEDADASNEIPQQHPQASSAESPAFVTETMAELLISQGFIERAATVYEELVRRRPYDPVLVSRLDELKQRLAASSPQAAPKATDALEEDEVVAESAPTPIVASFAVARDESEQRRSTARERFARLASRRVPRRTPPRAAVAIESPADGLAGLFGSADAETPDEYAARAFADAFAPVDEPPFDASNHTPVFVTRTITAPSTPVAEPPASRAQNETPSRSNAGFSFDRFFPDPATVAPTPPASPAAKDTPSSAQTPPVSDDLAEFAAWLKGLDKP